MPKCPAFSLFIFPVAIPLQLSPSHDMPNVDCSLLMQATKPFFEVTTFKVFSLHLSYVEGVVTTFVICPQCSHHFYHMSKAFSLHLSCVKSVFITYVICPRCSHYICHMSKVFSLHLSYAQGVLIIFVIFPKCSHKFSIKPHLCRFNIVTQ